MFTRRAVIAAAASTIALGALPRARAEQVLKIGYLLPKDSQLGAGATAFADEVAKRTSAKYRLEQYPNSVLGGDLEMIKGVQSGQIDIAFITSPPFTGLMPEFGVFEIPFLFRDAAHAHAVFDGPIGQEYLKKISAKDMVALAWGENGLRHLTNSKRPVKGPQDIAGLKIRVPQSDVMVQGFQALGATAEPLAFPALYGALEAGKFDAQENPIATIVAAKFDKVQKYLTMSGHVYSWAVFVMSKDAYEDLSEAERTAFAEAAVVGGMASRKFAADAEKSGVEVLRKAGMEVVTEVDRAAFVAALKPANQKFAEKYGAALIERIQNTQQKVSAR
jgi:TRAP-type transport system periplasmic protein